MSDLCNCSDDGLEQPLEAKFADSVHPQHGTASNAGAGRANNQNFGGVVACMQVVAIGQSQPAYGFDFDFGQFTYEVGINFGCLGGAGNGEHGVRRSVGLLNGAALADAHHGSIVMNVVGAQVLRGSDESHMAGCRHVVQRSINEIFSDVAPLDVCGGFAAVAGLRQCFAW